MNAYSSYHPIVLILYFLSVTTLTMMTVNPVFLTLALLGGLCYFALLKGAKEFFLDLAFYIPMMLLIAVVNPLFSHNGETILFFLNDNRVTLEAIIYGVFIAVLIVAIIYWFKCYNEAMTSDKFIYLFGKIIPKLSLILSMALRFVPEYKKQIKKISKAQKTLGLYSSNSIVDKITGGIQVFSILITWSLENSITTADSMKARGYGLKGRTSFSLFKFTLRDGLMLSIIVCIMSVIVMSISLDKVYFNYYPVINSADNSSFAIITYVLLCILVFIPFLIEVKENIRWKLLISKI